MGPRPGKAEAVGARKQVAGVRKRAEIGAAERVEQDVQASDRLDLEPRRAGDTARDDLQHGRLRVRGRECGRRDPRRPDERPRVGPEDTTHGTRSAALPLGVSTSPPVTTASAGRFDARAVTRTVSWRPGASTSLAGATESSRELDAMRTVSCRVETFLTTSAAVLCQPGPVQGPNESEVAEAEISSTAAAPGSTPPDGRAEPVSRLARSDAVRPGRACASSAAAPATVAAETLVPVAVVNAGSPSPAFPGSDVWIAIPGAVSCGASIPP